MPAAAWASQPAWSGGFASPTRNEVVGELGRRVFAERVLG